MADIQLQMHVAQGAPPYDPNLTLSPANAVTVYGSPYDPIKATVEAGAGIVENNHSDSYQFSLDGNGFGRFSVAALDLKLQEVSITVCVVGNETNQATDYAKFGLYEVGCGLIHGYAATTHGAADGASVLSCYLFVEPTQIDIGSITKIVAKVDGNAWLTSRSGKPQLDFIPIDDQGNATVNIADATAEFVNLTIAVPESPDGEFIKAKINFVEFPFTPSRIRKPRIARASRSMRVSPIGARE